MESTAARRARHRCAAGNGESGLPFDRPRETAPKCLLPFADLPLLDYWLDALGRAGVRDGRINTRHFVGRMRERVVQCNRGAQFCLVDTCEPDLLNAGSNGFRLLIAPSERCDTHLEARRRPRELAFGIDQRGSRIIFIHN